MLESRGRSWFLQVPLLLGAGQFFGGCEPAKRCWNLGTCVTVADAGDQDPMQGNIGRDSDVAAPATADPYTAGSQASTAISGSSAASEATETPGSATAPSSAPSAVPPSTTSSALTPMGETCTGDAQCPSGVCVDTRCVVCDASNDHGCETAATGKRCLASDAGNRCVECLAGDGYAGRAVACGLNDRGNQLFECMVDAWFATDCTDPDECKFGDLGDSEVDCGVNNSGHYANECTTGVWQLDTSKCIPDGACIDTVVKVGTTQCGFSGYLEERCVSGQWSVQSNCIECQRPFYLPDEGFALALRDHHDIDTNPLRPDLGMQYLNLSDKGIVDLTGIECFSHLTQLVAQNNRISDLTHLAGATELERLVLESNPLKDLKPLGALTKLTELDIGSSGLTSLDGLETCISLQALDAAYNDLEDVSLSPLLQLIKLETIWLGGNDDLACAGPKLTQLKDRVPPIAIYSDCP